MTPSSRFAYTWSMSEKPDANSSNDVPPDTYYYMGLDSLENGDIGAALEYLTKVIELEPGSPGGYYSRGNAYQDQGNYELSIDDYSRAIELKPDLWLAYFERAKSYQQLDQHGQAISDYDKVIELQRDFSQAYFSRGFSHRQLGDDVKAINDFNTYLEHDLDSHHKALAYNNLGNAYDGLGKYAEAISAFGMALEMEPWLHGTRYNRGLTHKSRGDKAAAIKDLKQVLVESDESHWQELAKQQLRQLGISV